jgi:hypothetical protein
LYKQNEPNAPHLRSIQFDHVVPTNLASDTLTEHTAISVVMRNQTVVCDYWLYWGLLAPHFRAVWRNNLLQSRMRQTGTTKRKLALSGFCGVAGVLFARNGPLLNRGLGLLDKEALK